jgi:hypothetical protein
MIVSRLACNIGFELLPGGVVSGTGSVAPWESTRYTGRSLPPPSRIGTNTTLSGIGADDGSVCSVLEEGVMVGVTVGVTVGVFDAGDGLGVAVTETLGEAVRP